MLDLMRLLIFIVGSGLSYLSSSLGFNRLILVGRLDPEQMNWAGDRYSRPTKLDHNDTHKTLAKSVGTLLS